MKLQIPADASDDLRAFALTLERALTAMSLPQRPIQLWSVATANLPAASAWPNSAVYVSDLHLIAVSTGVHWLKPDGTIIV